jgi:hypothetical protein
MQHEQTTVKLRNKLVKHQIFKQHHKHTTRTRKSKSANTTASLIIKFNRRYYNICTFQYYTTDYSATNSVKHTTTANNPTILFSRTTDVCVDCSNTANTTNNIILTKTDKIKLKTNCKVAVKYWKENSQTKRKFFNN